METTPTDRIKKAATPIILDYYKGGGPVGIDLAIAKLSHDPEWTIEDRRALRRHIWHYINNADNEKKFGEDEKDYKY